MARKPNLSYGQIWNLNVGYLGLQVCFSLIIANTSRILSGMGANVGELAFLWLVAPLSGLILQPIIGYFSDKTWTVYGRRIPYIFVGVVLTAVMMVFIPDSRLVSAYIPPVLAGVCVLFFMQSALNVAMQPYRSLIGDMVNEKQANTGFSVQTLLSNIGGIIGAVLPFTLAFWGISNQSEDGDTIVSSVAGSFYIGAGLLVLTNFWTCFKVKEYRPEQLRAFSEVYSDDICDSRLNKRKTIHTMLRLFVVQLFSWSAFYYMWVYTTDGIAFNVWGTTDPLSEDYNNAANWFGVLTGLYSTVAAVFSVFIPRLAEKVGRKTLYALALFLGSLSMLSIPSIENQYLLMLPMIGIGIAWAMILTVPFAILSSVVPLNRMGFFMGLFNVTIVVPQIVAGLAGGFVFENIVDGSAIGMLVVAGAALTLSSIFVIFVEDKGRGDVQ